MADLSWITPELAAAVKTSQAGLPAGTPQAQRATAAMEQMARQQPSRPTESVYALMIRNYLLTQINPEHGGHWTAGEIQEWLNRQGASYEQIYNSLMGDPWRPQQPDQLGQRTQIITQMVDGVPHDVLIDMTTGQVIQDLGPSADYSWQEQQLQAQREEAERQRQMEWAGQLGEWATQPRQWIPYWQATEGGVRQPSPGWFSQETPPTPSWLTQFTGQQAGAPIESRQVKMAGPQTWGQMAPSAQQGLGGYLGWTGVPEEDYFKRMQRAWTGVFPAGQTWMTRWGAR